MQEGLIVCVHSSFSRNIFTLRTSVSRVHSHHLLSIRHSDPFLKLETCSPYIILFPFLSLPEEINILFWLFVTLEETLRNSRLTFTDKYIKL